MNGLKRLLFALAGVGLIATALDAQSPASSPTAGVAAAPVEPIAAIVEAFRSHAVVALGDHHANEQIHAFRLALIRDPRFATTVNDIVVEFGDARFQDLIDRFVRGENVPDTALQQVWQDTTQTDYTWDLPIYEEFFRTVRAVNGSLPRERQVRVLLGDPPIDWDQVRTADDYRGWLRAVDRDAYAVSVIRQEVLAKGRRALVIYGDQHLLRKNTVVGAPDQWARGIVAQLERAGSVSVFTVLPETRNNLTELQADVASWPRPSLASIRGTSIGTALFQPGTAPSQRPVRNEEQFDAVLYLGPVSMMTMARLSPALCADRRYLDLRLARLSLLPPPAGAPISPAESLREYCAHGGNDAEIADSDPGITELIRATLGEAARGNVDPARIAPESRPQIVPFLQQNGPRFLGPAGTLELLTLLADHTDDGRYVRSYRAVFANGQRIIWVVGLSPGGLIVSLDPRPE